jgi:recombination endonuclease VII
MSAAPLPNEKDLKRRYGLTLDQYVELLDAQGGVCAVCHKPPTERTGPLVVDHNHDTLEIDGLVHSSPCNRRLLQQVRRYLANPPGRRFGFKVPPELEQKTIARREAGKTAARERRAAARRPGAAPGSAPSYLPRLQELTRQTDEYAAKVDAALAATVEPAPTYGWTEPPPPTGPVDQLPPRRPRRLRFNFRSGGSVRSGG